MHQEILFIYFASILPLGMASQWLAWRMRLPSILLLLAFGFLAGWIVSAGTSYENVDALLGEHSEQLLFPIVSLSVAVILFEGGLTLQLRDLREGGRALCGLVSLGALVSWVTISLAAYYILALDWRIAILQGAILVVTGPTVIAPMLRQIRPAKRVGNVAKWEGIVIDPVGAILAVLVFEAVLATSASEAILDVVWGFVYTGVAGAIVGLAIGWLLLQLLRRFLVPDFLQSSFILAVVLAAFAISNLWRHESGLIAVTVMGVFLANQKKVTITHVRQFKENLQVLLISMLFIVLASRLEPSVLLDLGQDGRHFLIGVLFMFVLIFVVRPLSVFLGTIGSKINLREKLFLCFLAPRGIVAAAVASIFAMNIALEGKHLGLPESMIAQAQQLVPITFLVIVGTVTFYGLTAAPLARLLKLSEADPQGLLFAGAEPWVLPIAKTVQVEGVPVLMVDTNYQHTVDARMEGIPARCASVLSEYVSEEMDLGGIGRLLAVTPNDGVNTLATHELSHLFGSSRVFQLAPHTTASHQRSGVAPHLKGRILFRADTTYEDITSRIDRGMQVKKTLLSDEYSYDDFSKRYGEDALVLFIIEPDGRLIVMKDDEKFDPKPGQKIIALVDEDNDEQSEANSVDV